ncbi:5-hydroxytryptamine receptor 3A-like isoform X1 [Ranitomeya imitator]|uniref:5-hydroxytryptamine receptor 3A-like isoform X1 n=2 Tax=Ranitomeya imitator TaxID=111125 RepID=UPI0037E7880A
MAFPVSPLLLAVAILVGEASCETDCGFYDLLASLNITDPPPDERPVTDWRNVTTVYLDFTLYAIVKLDMNQQTVISYVWFYMSWQNEFLLWDPDDFCGIESLLIPSDYFWKPDLYISEMTEEDHKSPVISYYNLTNNGKISNSKPLRVVSTCNLDLYKFPFDTQTCRLTFRSYLYTVRDLVMVPKSNSYEVNKNSQEAFVPKGDWILVDITVQNLTYDFLNDGFSQVIYEVTLKRAAVIYIINLIIPACFLVFLDIASMFIQDFGERLGFKINVILGFSVLLLILNNMLPHSNSTPMLGIFFSFCMAMMVFSILGSVCCSYLFEQSAKHPHVPQWLETTVLKYLAHIMCFKKTLYTQEGIANGSMPKGPEEKPSSNVEVEKLKHDSEKKQNDNVRVKILKRLLLEVLKFHQQLALVKNAEESKSLWHKVAYVVDRFILILYLIIVSIVFISMIVVWAI